MTELTDRQKVILDLLSEGYVEKQVATYMGVSVDTVKGHTKEARRRLEARNTTHAVAIYLRAKKFGVASQGAGDNASKPVSYPVRSPHKASPHGNPKPTSATPAAVVPPLRPRAALVQWLSFRAVDGARRSRILL